MKDYTNFIDNIEIYILELCSSIGVDRFTYSYDEIDTIQDYFDQKYQDSVNENEERLSYYFAAYFGEAFRFYNGGRWTICDFKKDEAYKTPIIIDWGSDNFPHVSISVYVWEEYLKRGLMDEKFTDIIKRAQIPMSNE